MPNTLLQPRFSSYPRQINIFILHSIQDPALNLLTYATAPPNAPGRQAWYQSSNMPSNCDDVARLALKHHVVLRASQGFQEIGLPPFISEIDRRQMTMRTLTLASALVEVVRFFRNSDIEVIALKGPALSQALFATLSLRDPGDLDLLIRSHDILRADHILRALGYERETIWDEDFAAGDLSRPVARVFHIHYWCPVKQVAVELHWRWFHLEEIMPDDAGVIWQNVKTVLIAGTPVTILAPPTQLLYLAFHASKHECERLQWVNDLAWLVVNLDDGAISAAVATAQRLEILDLFAAPFLVVAALGLGTLPSAIAPLANRRAVRRLAAYFLDRLENPHPSAMIGSWRQRLFWYRNYWRLAATRDGQRRAKLLCRLVRNAVVKA